jgi:hypothetical protein
VGGGLQVPTFFVKYKKRWEGGFGFESKAVKENVKVGRGEDREVEKKDKL